MSWTIVSVVYIVLVVLIGHYAVKLMAAYERKRLRRRAREMRKDYES